LPGIRTWDIGFERAAMEDCNKIDEASCTEVDWRFNVWNQEKLDNHPSRGVFMNRDSKPK